MLSVEDVSSSVFSALNRAASPDELEIFVGQARSLGYSRRQLASALRASSEAVSLDLGSALDDHLFLIHRARVGLMATMLPRASRILDIGGANAPLCDAGYTFQFDELVVVDLPPADRHEEFAGRIVTDRMSPLGPVRVAYTPMTDLSMFEPGSFDLVWSGQSIEHVTVGEARETFREVARVIAPGGWFCLDTPNRLVTSIHANGGMIHPDHKHEYDPQELIQELRAAGFAVERSLGVCDMPLTVASGEIDYRDFVVGSGITASLSTAYIQFHACRPIKN